MTDFQYERAPITEAVVEFRSATSVDDKKRKKGVKQLGRNYSKSEPLKQQTVEVKFQPSGSPLTTTTDVIVDKYSSDDMTQQLLVSDVSFLVSQLAPYPGWNQFEQRIRRDWDTWRSCVGFREINRIGVRYINRLDLPFKDEVVHHEDYVTVYPALPKLFNSISKHSVNVSLNLADIQSTLNLTSAVVPSPLPNHLSIVVDLDIVKNCKEPPNDEELFLFINQARTKKNEIFEACITDKSRELFGQ